MKRGARVKVKNCYIKKLASNNYEVFEVYYGSTNNFATFEEAELYAKTRIR